MPRRRRSRASDGGSSSLADAVPRARRNKSEDDVTSWIGCLWPLVLLWVAALGIQLAMELTAWISGELPLVVGALAIAVALALGAPRALRRWRARRRAPPSPDLLGILTLSSYGFEAFCRDLLEREGYTAFVTKQTGDQGVDIELRARDGRTGVAQCKQVLNTKIGRPVVQNLYGEMISRGATFGYVITTGTFTLEAVGWARPKAITLVDRDALLAMVERQRRRR